MSLIQHIRTVAAGLAATLLAVACGGLDVEFPPEQPDGYLTLLRYYQKGEEFVSCKSMDITTLLTFGYSTLSLKHSDLEVHDCTATGRPPICVDDTGSYWLIGGKNSWIGYHKGFLDKDAQPVYLYFDAEGLHLFISNGNVLDFPKLDASFIPETFVVPTVYISYGSGSISKDTYKDMEIIINDPSSHYSEATRMTAKGQIKGRGNSTWGMPKKPYRIKLSEKAEVLGMPANKDWVLLANYADKSLLRNTTAMQVSRILEFPWTPRSRQVELYLNNTYMGVYDLFEHKEVAKEKVNIEKQDWYLEIEQTIDEKYYFYTSKGVPIQVKHPSEPTSEQLAYIKGYFKDFEAALFGSSFKDAAKGYAAYIDVESFVDNYIIEELSKDIDGNVRKSSFLTLCEGGKLRFYHQWDFDLAFGNADYFPGNANGPTGWWIKDYGTNSTKNNGWYWRLFQDPAFVGKVKQRWAEVYPDLVNVPKYIDKAKSEMGYATTRNFNKWKILNTYVWPNVKVTGSYDKEVEYLESFYNDRLEWLNNNLPKL